MSAFISPRAIQDRTLQVMSTVRVLNDVEDERARQDAKWGPVQDHPDIHPGWTNFNYRIPRADQAKRDTDSRAQLGHVTYTDILIEEVCEAIEEAAKGDAVALREELIQVAAVAVKWVELLDMRAQRGDNDSRLAD